MKGINGGNTVLLKMEGGDLAQIFTKRRIELIGAIQENGPRKMSELARVLDRELSAVKRDLDVLQKAGIVQMEKNGREVTTKIEKEFLVLPLNGR